MFDAAHPRPADAKDAASAAAGPHDRRRTRSFGRWRSSPDAFREDGAGCARVMVGDRFRGEFSLVDPALAARPGRTASRFIMRVLTRPGGDRACADDRIVPNGVGRDTLVVWVDPAGRRAAFEDDGRTLSPVARAARRQGRARARARSVPDGRGRRARRTPVKDEEKYAGYYYGYNRSVARQPGARRADGRCVRRTTPARAMLHVIGTGAAGALGADRASAGRPRREARGRRPRRVRLRSDHARRRRAPAARRAQIRRRDWGLPPCAPTAAPQSSAPPAAPAASVGAASVAGLARRRRRDARRAGEGRTRVGEIVNARSGAISRACSAMTK